MAISVYLVLCMSMSTVNLCTAIKFGRCNDTFFLTKAMNCEKTFYRKLISGSSANNCSQLYKVHVYDCYKETLLQCYRDAIYNWPLYVRVGLLTLDAFGQAQFYCSTNKTIGKLSEMPEEVRKYFPCSNEYLEKGQKCADKVRNIIAKNPKDRALCREYSRSVLCTQEVAKTHCNTTIDVLGDLGENPFCLEVEDKDNVTEITSKQLTEDKNDTKTKSMVETSVPSTTMANVIPVEDKDDVTEITSKQLTEDKNDIKAKAMVETSVPSTSMANVSRPMCGVCLLIAMLVFLFCIA